MEKINELKIINILNNHLGLNKKTLIFLCNKLGINYKKATNKNLNNYLYELIKKEIRNNFILDDKLNYIINENKNEYKINKTYKGFKLTQGLPIRGQRTRSNAKTSRKIK